MPPKGADEVSPRSGVNALFVSDWDSFAPRRELLLSAVTKVAKSTGRNYVSALPQRAMPVHCHPRFPSRNRRFPDRCRSPDCASTAFRCRCLLLRQKLFVLPCRRLRNNYILCPTGTPTFAALRRQRRDLIIANASSAPDPTLAQRQRQRRKRYKRSPEPTTSPAEPIPRSQHRQIRTCPPRAKGSLDRRSKRLSFPHFFLRRKKCGRRRPPPRQGETDSPPQRRNSPNPVEANTPTVAGASGRASLRAGERRHSPFDRQ